MKRYQLLLLALSCTGVFAGATLYAKPARNPIIWADVPDVAVIRAGGWGQAQCPGAHWVALEKLAGFWYIPGVM